MATAARLFAPEVIQSSGMDCGPASLKSLLDGFGIPVSYGRLREACQTGVDGTSIDTLESTAVALGLEAEQIMVPVDHLLLSVSKCLPAIVVVNLSSHATHFVVLWRSHGPWLQLMDPAVGRRWVHKDAFLRDVHVHTQPVPAEAWRSWAGGDQFGDGLRARMRALGIAKSKIETLVTTALAVEHWRTIGALDAAVRMAAALNDAEAIPRGGSTTALIENLVRDPKSIPQSYWSVLENPADPETVGMRGAVLVRAIRANPDRDPDKLPPELRAAVKDPPAPPLAAIAKTIREDGIFTPFAVTLAFALAALGVAFEALLYRGLLDLARTLSLAGQRAGAIAAILIFLVLLLAIEWPAEAAVLRIGRRLENRFRLKFLLKLPLLADRYFQSRLVSDMAQRAHSTHLLRQLPQVGAQLIRGICALAATLAAIAWFYPATLPLAALCGTFAVFIPLLAQPALVERDLRQREHSGALTRFYLDALLGLSVIRAHGGQRALRREQEKLLEQWAEAGIRLQRAVVRTEALQFIAVTACVIAIVLERVSTSNDIAGLLLLVYWILSLSTTGQDIANALWQYPALRNTTLRIAEPLGSPEQPRGSTNAAPTAATGLAIDIDSATVVAGGHTILDGVSLTIKAGEHIAIVGRSGAGKSSLAGLLLGWFQPIAGSVKVDGATLDAARTDQLRLETAWIDPQIQLWNRTLIDNLVWGGNQSASMEPALDDADLRGVLERLPEGFETVLGEGGGLVSGGQGQRVRAGRAFLRSSVRLAILDEPSRGLDRHNRRRLIDRARKRWQSATMIVITHDVIDTESFSRVLVIEDGRIIEDGAPQDLRSRDTRYKALYDAEREVRETLWQGERWRKIRIDAGILKEDASAK